ncbi:hypothetical protein Tco_0738390 [Tanacetum coccineum]
MLKTEPPRAVAAGRWIPVEEELLAKLVRGVGTVSKILISEVQRRVQRAKCLEKSGENDVDYLTTGQSIYVTSISGVAFSQDDAMGRLRIPEMGRNGTSDLTGDVHPGASQEDLFVYDDDHSPTGMGKQRPAKKKQIRRYGEHRAFEAQAEKDRTLMRLEELRFLATSTKDLDEDDAYWIKKQKKLIKNKMKNDLGDEDDEDEDE